MDANIRYTIVEIFAGTGAFSLAFESTGKVASICATDISSSSKKIIHQNIPHAKFICKDIHDLKIHELPSMDILTAGFPCQPFSIAGKKHGFEDTRSDVFWKLVDIIRFHTPRCIVLENVKNLITHNKGKSLETIISTLENCGYSVYYKLLNVSSYTNIPQNRERVFFVCFKTDKHPLEFRWNLKPIHTVSSLQHFLDSNVPPYTYYTPESRIWELLYKTVKPNEDDGIVKVYQYRRTYVRMNKSNLVPTLTANMGTGGHNIPIIHDSQGIRKLTPRECFNLQGFPETYQIENIGLSRSALYTLAGNAVNVKLVELIAKEIVYYLEITEETEIK